MGFLAKLLNYVPRHERGGLVLDSAGTWELSGVTDAPGFLRALHRLIPTNCNLYVEGTNETAVADWLASRPASSPVQVAVATIWPKPDIHHMPATEKNLSDLAAFLESSEIHYPWSHCQVYGADSIVVSWHDSQDSPIYVAGIVEESAVAAFCNETNCKYAQVERAS
jgi:hypothetical protein